MTLFFAILYWLQGVERLAKLLNLSTLLLLCRPAISITGFLDSVHRLEFRSEQNFSGSGTASILR
jgi:hypothetical protein